MNDNIDIPVSDESSEKDNDLIQAFNLSRKKGKLVSHNKDKQGRHMVDEVEHIFNQLDTPIPTIQSHDAQEHICSHVGHITALLGFWAHSLNWIDEGAGDGTVYLARKFFQRFVQVFGADYRSALEQSVLLPDASLRARFSLDDVDLFILWTLAALELDPSFKQALRSTWKQNTSVCVNASVLMRFVCTDVSQRMEMLARLAPSGKLASTGLIRIALGSSANSPLFAEISLSGQVLHRMSGVRSLSIVSTQYAELQIPNFSEDTFVSKTHHKTLEIIRNYIDRPPLNSLPNLDPSNLNFVPSLAFLVEGLPGTGRTTLVKLVASVLKRPVIIVQSSPLVGLHPMDLETYFKTLFMDAVLMDAFLCFRDASVMVADDKLSSILSRQLSKHSVVCAFCVELSVKLSDVMEPYVTFKAKMDANLRDSAPAFWNQHLDLPFVDSSHVDVGYLSERLALQPFQIQKAARLAYYSTDIDDNNSVMLENRSIEKAASVQVTKNIGNLAFVSDPEVTLKDVIVSNDIMSKIKQIIGSAINRRRVLYEWGLSRRIRRGTGIIALFDGEPGTGKTHSAEAIANALGLSLMRVNIASMVDKYVGETEKNLTTIFEQARPDMQLLLFDEADSLFTKRSSDVSKSNDRYSNMSVNVLLQLVERYEGVSILTTNLKNAIDSAFERRITYKVYFPMPKKIERKRLWEYMCPPDVLTAEPIDYDWLSELEMSGGEIKNAVLTAAFNAATKGVLLNNEFLYDAGVTEASSAGRVMRRYDEKKSNNVF